jgi:hypothetical protein
VDHSGSYYRAWTGFANVVPELPSFSRLFEGLL